MSRALPTSIDSQTTDSTGYKNAIRSWLEYITGANPYFQIDWTTYHTVLRWAMQDGYRPIIEEVLKRRLTSGSATTAHNAVILAQTLPPASLLPLIDPLKKLLPTDPDSPVTQTTVIAQTLVRLAEEENAKRRAGEDEARWNAWCGLYGKPTRAHGLPPLPNEVEWGLWSLVHVSPEDWWNVPTDDRKD